jgi:GTP-binding protein
LQFLRHIERTRLLVHLIDMASASGHDPLEAFHQVNRELGAYGKALPSKPQVIVANKMDLPQAREHVKRFERAVGQPVWPISCATGQGVPRLLQAIWSRLHA